tara:strand:- start:609 stop:827 length:219 start_codon:yes stop_codon:yes gene_type:complete
MREMNESKQQKASLRRGGFRSGFTNQRNLKKDEMGKIENQCFPESIVLLAWKKEQKRLKEQGRLISEYLASF